MDRFEFEETPLQGLFVLKRKKLIDPRGSLSRLFCSDEFKKFGFESEIAQINHTVTETAGTVRGMHFQIPPFAEKKIVYCMNGSVMDVVIDLRDGSPTFLKNFSIKLSAQNLRCIFIPEGFAHGFQSLENNSHLIYLHSQSYQPNFETGLHPLDPSLKIEWPLEITQISDRDQNHQLITRKNFSGVKI